MPLDHFDLIAPIYARARYRDVERMQELAALPTPGRLLDVGGGTGRVASALHGLVDEIVITDISMGMLRRVPRPRFTPACCFCESLPFPNDSFERLILVDALHHVVDQAASAREMLRVLKPGGLLVIEEPDIRNLPVRLIALAEKLLLMRSHFLAPDEIASLFPRGSVRIVAEDSSAWIVVQKQPAE